MVLTPRILTTWNASMFTMGYYSFRGVDRDVMVVRWWWWWQWLWRCLCASKFIVLCEYFPFQELADFSSEATSTAGDMSDNRLKNRFINILPCTSRLYLLQCVLLFYGTIFTHICHIF